MVLSGARYFVLSACLVHIAMCLRVYYVTRLFHKSVALVHVSQIGRACFTSRLRAITSERAIVRVTCLGLYFAKKAAARRALLRRNLNE